MRKVKSIREPLLFISAGWFILVITGCDFQGSATIPSEAYFAHMGDIPFAPALDDPQFQLCAKDSVVHSRLSLTYEGGFNKLEDACKAQFKFQNGFQSFTGFVMIHFLVNCNYESDRFRVETMGLDFSPLDCPSALREHLVDIVRGLDKWKRTSRYEEPVDCSKYLNFKITNGKIESIIH